MNIGETIKELRKKKGISQTELAALCNITQTSLSQIEVGKKSPHESTLTKISKVLGVPVMYIYFLSFDENDVPEDKQEAYKILGPYIKQAINQLFTETTKENLLHS